jgi:hypothetical protein
MDRREVMGVLAAGGLTAAGGVSSAAAPAPKQNPDEEHLKFVADCHAEIRKLSRSIATRKDLLEKFKPAGGLYNRTLQSFSYIRCPWFKVSVTFEPADDGRDGKPEDKVTKVSTPYLEDPFAE